jgi:HlyD family secretion protein
LDGVVSRQDAKIGQVVSAATTLVSVIGNSLEIEAFIPEVLISGVSVGNEASVTLDAYGPEEIFGAKVIHLDPAETIRDGVSTYKVRLTFNNPDLRIRPGMTANILIETLRKPNVLLIPERAVVKEDGEIVLYTLDNKDKQRIMIEIGERDSAGNVELLSPLPLDTQIIINP